MSFIFSYLFWHYTKALKNIFGIFANFLWVTYRFFSLPLLFRTFFSPWRRLGSQYESTLDIGEFFGTLIVNTLMRIVGMFIRFFTILLGILSLILIIIAGIGFFIVWILLPFIIVWLFYKGVIKIFE